jgi:uncharacterized lipoprotein YmbA
MDHSIVYLLSIELTAAAMVGWGTSAPARFYNLDLAASSQGAPLHASVIVGPVTIPASVDQPQFVVQVQQPCRGR